MSKTVLFQTIQLRIITQFSSIQPIDRTLPGAIIPGQSGPRSDGNEGVLCILQSSSITETSLSDCLVSYQDTRSCPPAELQSVFSTASADLASVNSDNIVLIFKTRGNDNIYCNTIFIVNSSFSSVRLIINF